MKGQVTIRKVDKLTGDSSVIYKDNNQTTVGFAHAMVNVLTGTGSRNVDDYGLRYFQLGEISMIYLLFQYPPMLQHPHLSPNSGLLRVDFHVALMV